MLNSGGGGGGGGWITYSGLVVCVILKCMAHLKVTMTPVTCCAYLFQWCGLFCAMILFFVLDVSFVALAIFVLHCAGKYIK